MLGNTLPPGVFEDVQRWIRDDIPSFDYGGYVVGDKQEIANLYCKSSCIVAGIPFAQGSFRINIYFVALRNFLKPYLIT